MCVQASPGQHRKCFQASFSEKGVRDHDRSTRSPSKVFQCANACFVSRRKSLQTSKFHVHAHDRRYLPLRLGSSRCALDGACTWSLPGTAAYPDDIGGYTPIKLIGTGTFGAVYAETFLRAPRKLALGFQFSMSLRDEQVQDGRQRQTDRRRGKEGAA
jgi:hypothetical protein